MANQIRRDRKFDFSGAIQDATTWLLKKPTELKNGINLRFDNEIGEMLRRNGYQKTGSSPATFATSKTPRGGFVAKYTTGPVRMIAVTNSGSTATIIRTQNSTTGAWTDLASIPSWPADSEIFFFYFNDEVFVTGYTRSTGVPITPCNIDNTLSVSTTRNIQNMPPCYFLTEFNGNLYASNVYFGSTRYPNRSYQSSAPLGAITFVKGAQSGISTTWPVDSVRYLKVGMVLDLYKAGTETELYDSITITAVDKNLGTFSFTGVAQTITADSTTDKLAMTSTTGLATGTTVQVATNGGTLPTPLVAGTDYYVITVDSTHIKLASTLALAIAGTPIDITANGSGTITLATSYNLSDNDEIWPHGRKAVTTILWNTDFPTMQTADYLGILPGADSDYSITAAIKSSNRLFLFTRYSGNRWDGQNLVTFNTTVGCIAARSLQNLEDDWMIWLDAEGNVRARNETTGQQQKISKGIYKNWLKKFPQTTIKDANATTFGSKYKLYLGQLPNAAGGNDNIRAVYDFDANTWTVEKLANQAYCQFTDDFTGVNLPYFLTETDYLMQDETGNDDDGTVIPMYGEIGNDMLGTEAIKGFYGCLIFSKDAIGLTVQVKVDDEDDWKTVGEIRRNVHFQKFAENGQNKIPDGTYINVRLTGSVNGDAPSVRGLVSYYVIKEDTPGGPGR